MLRSLFVVLAVVQGTAAANAKGFATTDLTGVEASVRSVLGPDCVTRAAPAQLTGACEGAAGKPIVSIQLGRQVDGTEERVRSGATKISDLERLCQARSAECTLSAVEAGPAVGWLSTYPLGLGTGVTVVMIRDGDMLTLRCIADDPGPARATVDRLLPILRAGVIGP